MIGLSDKTIDDRIEDTAIMQGRHAETRFPNDAKKRRFKRAVAVLEQKTEDVARLFSLGHFLHQRSKLRRRADLLEEIAIPVEAHRISEQVRTVLHLFNAQRKQSARQLKAGKQAKQQQWRALLRLLDARDLVEDEAGTQEGAQPIHRDLIRLLAFDLLSDTSTQCNATRKHESGRQTAKQIERTARKRRRNKRPSAQRSSET